MSRFAYLTQLGEDVVLVRTDGSWQMLSEYSTIDDAVTGLDGTLRARSLGLPRSGLVHVETASGRFAVDRSRTAPVAVHHPDVGWQPAVAFPDSALDPLLFIREPTTSRPHAEASAHAALDAARRRRGDGGRAVRRLLSRLRR